MPKKIKKRTKKTEEELESLDQAPEGGEEEEGPVLLDEDGMPIRQEEYDEVANFGDIVVDIPEHERDAFEKLSHDTANWIEKNRPIAMGLFFLVLAAPLLVYFGYEQVKASQVGKSNDVTAAIEAYQYPVENSPMMKFFEQNEKFKKPTVVYKTSEEKWNAVYTDADKALKTHASDDLGVSARYAKAGAAYHLGKYDEAISLYQEVLKDERGDALHLFASLGLAMSQAGKGDVDAAVKTFDTVKDTNAEFAGFAQYHKGRVLEAAGKVDEAKAVYNSLLEGDSNSTYKLDVERRLATL